MDNPDFDHRPHSTEDDYDIIGRLASQLQFTSSNQITPSQIRTLITALPRLTEAQIISLGHQDSVCPICLTPFLALLAEEETALAMDSPAHPVEELGVTRLAETWQCGHAFCRRDISKWIQAANSSCPYCRHALVEYSESTSSNINTQEEQEFTFLRLLPHPLQFSGRDRDISQAVLEGWVQGAETNHPHRANEGPSSSMYS